jgi:hypothetical protein
MTSKAKGTHKGGHAAHATAKAKEPKPTPPVDWAKQMIESLTDAQKRWVDMAAEQNALVLKAVSEGVNFYKSAPTPALADWTKQAVKGIFDAQKRWADITSKQSKQFGEALRDDTDFEDVGRGFSDFTSYGVETFVKARTQWLDFVAEQNERALKTLKDSLDLDENSSATALAEFAQQAVANYVEVQKRWLDLLTQLPVFRPAEKK